MFSANQNAIQQLRGRRMDAPEKRIRQMAPVRVTECEEIELMRIAARLDRSLAWVRRAAYRDFILSHGGSVAADDSDDNNSHASLMDSPQRGMS